MDIIADEQRRAAAPAVIFDEMRPQAEEVDEAAWVPLVEAPAKVAYRDLRSALAAAAQVLETRPS